MCFWGLTYTIDGIINFKIYLGSYSKAIADRQEKRER